MVISSLITLLLPLLASASTIDRVAVVVGKDVITESEVQQEVRLTEFLNHQPLDISAEERKAAADRLVDQQLIRNEMVVGQYSQPSDEDAEKMLRSFRRENYAGNDATLRAALEKYGLTEDDLKRHLRWQLAAMRFTDQRFRVGVPGDAEAQGQGEASRTAEPNSTVAVTAAGSTDRSVDQQMDSWLKEARGQTKVVFKKEAFR